MKDINEEIAELQEQLAHIRYKVTEMEGKLLKLIALSDGSFIETQMRNYLTHNATIKDVRG